MFAEDFKVLKSHKECLETYGSDFLISKEITEGRLFRVDRGMYSDRKYVPLIEIAEKRYPHSVVTLDSAFYYHGLTDVIPDALHLATDRKAARIADRRICQHFVPAEILHVGETQITHNGSSVKTYDLERLCIEVVRNKPKLPYDFYKEVVLSLRSRAHEMYPAKIDDYLAFFPYRNKVFDLIEKEIF